jgi:hypothetical protein
VNSRHSSNQEPSNHASSNHANPGRFATSVSDRETLSEEAFHRMMSIERRRTARSRKLFLLMLLDMGEPMSARSHQLSLRQVMSTLSQMLRETDVTGWYKENSVVGVMFTEITLEDETSIPASLMTRVTQMLRSQLTPHQFHQIGISFHLLPETVNHGVSAQEAIPATMFPGISAASGASETSF